MICSFIFFASHVSIFVLKSSLVEEQLVNEYKNLEWHKEHYGEHFEGFHGLKFFKNYNYLL